MSDRFYTDVELPDLGSDAATPEAGFVTFYGKTKRPFARNSDGEVFDLASPLIHMGSSTKTVKTQIVCMTVQTAADGTLAVTFSTPFKTGTVPNVQLTPLATLTTQPTIAEISTTPTATGVAIKTYRTKTQGVLLGGTINPTQEQQAFVMLTAIGEAP